MIRVYIFNTHRGYRPDVEMIRRTARRVFRGEKRSDAECNIVFIQDDRMIELNGEYLDHWFTTDVLTFPLSDAEAKELTGEIYINIDQARRQALDYDVFIKDEILRLAIHGTLHLMGYQDTSKRQKAEMTRLEDFYLKLK